MPNLAIIAKDTRALSAARSTLAQLLHKAESLRREVEPIAESLRRCDEVQARAVGQFGDLGSDLIGDLAPLATRGFGILLSKRGGDEGGNDTPPLLAGVGQHIAHEVHAAALPGGVQHLGNRRLKAFMPVRDHQLNAAPTIV